MGPSGIDVIASGERKQVSAHVRRVGARLSIMSEGGQPQPKVFANRWAEAVGPAGTVPDRDGCECFEQRRRGPQPSVSFHPDRQDTSAPGWLRLLALIEAAVADGREEFKPLVELTAEEGCQIITLPDDVAPLGGVLRLSTSPGR